MFIRYLIFLFSSFLVVPSFARVVQVSTDGPDAQDLGMLLQLAPSLGEPIDEIRVGSNKLLSVDLQDSSLKVSKHPATGLYYFDVLINYFVPSPEDAGFRSSYIRLQCPIVRKSYFDDSRPVSPDGERVWRTVDRDILKEEVLLKGTYEFLPLADVDTQTYIGNLPMKGEIRRNSDFKILCLEADLTYLELKLIKGNRKAALKE